MVNGQTPPGIKSWLDIILDSLDEEIDETRYRSPIFGRVIDAVKLDNISSEESRVLKDEEDWEDTLIYEHNQGRKVGLAEGQQQEKEAIVRLLISEGSNTEFITRITGLPEAEIERLRQS
jgi:hypothetical protein